MGGRWFDSLIQWTQPQEGNRLHAWGKKVITGIDTPKHTIIAPKSTLSHHILLIFDVYVSRAPSPQAAAFHHFRLHVLLVPARKREFTTASDQ